jgi:hypothetical protein
VTLLPRTFDSHALPLSVTTGDTACATGAVAASATTIAVMTSAFVECFMGRSFRVAGVSIPLAQIATGRAP